MSQPQAPAPAHSEKTKAEAKEKVSQVMIANLENETSPVLPEEDYINKQDVANRLKRSVRTIDYWRATGLLPYYKVGKFVYFRWSEVQAAIAKLCRRVD